MVTRFHGYIHIPVGKQLSKGAQARLSISQLDLPSDLDYCVGLPHIASCMNSCAVQYVGLAQGIQGTFALSAIPGMLHRSSRGLCFQMRLFSVCHAEGHSLC